MDYLDLSHFCNTSYLHAIPHFYVAACINVCIADILKYVGHRSGDIQNHTKKMFWILYAFIALL